MAMDACMLVSRGLWCSPSYIGCLSRTTSPSFISDGVIDRCDCCQFAHAERERKTTGRCRLLCRSRLAGQWSSMDSPVDRSIELDCLVHVFLFSHAELQRCMSCLQACIAAYVWYGMVWLASVSTQKSEPIPYLPDLITS